MPSSSNKVRGPSDGKKSGASVGGWSRTLSQEGAQGRCLGRPLQQKSASAEILRPCEPGSQFGSQSEGSSGWESKRG